jgi:phage gpG-like protein
MVADTQVVRGAAKLSRRIATIRKNLNVPDLTEEIGALLLKRTQQRFDAMVTPDYLPWVELAPATVLRRKALGYGGEGPKLKRTLGLRNAIKIIRGNVTGSTFLNTGAGLRIGIDDPEIAKYARVQNKGHGRIPARQFLGIGRLDIKAVDSLMRRKAKAALGA